ncbi:hypothetical protein F5883DRAFT_441795, partial [Diaporthe sp. PMI_573]
GIAVFFNNFINPIALEAIQRKYYFIFVVILVPMVVIIWLYYPETRGRTLENMAWLFDGDNTAGTITITEYAIKMSNIKHIEEIIEWRSAQGRLSSGYASDV